MHREARWGSSLREFGKTRCVYWSERDKGTIIAFVGGEKDAVTVQEKPE